MYYLGEQALHIASSFAARNVTVTIFGCNTEIERLILAKAASLDLKSILTLCTHVHYIMSSYM